MTTDDLHRIYELEAQIDQAIQIMLNLSASVKAMKPPSKPRKKMTKEEIIQHFRAARMDARKARCK